MTSESEETMIWTAMCNKHPSYQSNSFRRDLSKDLQVGVFFVQKYAVIAKHELLKLYVEVQLCVY